MRSRLDFRRMVLLQFAVFAAVVGVMGMAAFGLLLVDFQSPGLLKPWRVLDGGMSLDLVLLVAFGLQHSLMARRSFKAGMARLMPPELERSFYVMMSGFALFTLAMLWWPTMPPLYDLRGTVPGWALMVLAALGLPVMALAARGVDWLDLVGLRSVLRIWRGAQPEAEPFVQTWIYRQVRHPLYLGMLMLFWFTPAMTHDHLFFAEVMTAYLLIGIQFEERDLVRQYGDAYRKYQAEVPMLIPFLRLPQGR